MKKALIAPCVFLLISNQIMASDLFSIHTGLPDPEATEIPQKFKFEIDKGVNLYGIVRHRIIGPQEWADRETTAVRETFTLKTAPGSLSIEGKETKYITCDDYGCTYLGNTSSFDSHSKPKQAFNIPYTAQIGDSGLIGTYIDQSDDITDCEWRLEDGGENLAIFKTRCSLVNGDEEQSIETEALSLTIDREGNCKSLMFESYSTDEDQILSIKWEGICNGDKSFLRIM